MDICLMQGKIVHQDIDAIAYNCLSDNPFYCPHCQAFSYHFVGSVSIVDRHSYTGHIWYFRCINPNCKRVFVKVLGSIQEKQGLYMSERTPIRDMSNLSGIGLAAPTNLDSIYDEPKLIPGIEAITGWLSPDGIYYPCHHENVYNTSFQVNYNHDGYARAICFYILGLTNEQIEVMDASQVQSYLLSEGWARLDLNSVLPDIRGKFTDNQIKTMRLIVAKKPLYDDSVDREKLMYLVNGYNADGSRVVV